MERLKGGEFKTIHAGFDPAAADADPNVITPIDALKVLEKEGVYGSLHPYFYTTVGTGTTEAEAARMAKKKSFHIFRKIMLMVLSWLVPEVLVHVAVQRW